MPRITRRFRRVWSPDRLLSFWENADGSISPDMHVNLQVGDVDASNANPIPFMRSFVTGTAEILNGANLSDEIDMARMASGNLYIPAVWTAASIGFYVAPVSGGAFLPLYDHNGNLVQIVAGAVTNQAHSFPPEVFACQFIQLWSQNAGVNAAQGGERALLYELKS